MSGARVEAVVKAIKAPHGKAIDARLDLRQIRWHDGEKLGPDGLDPRALDLLEVARVVWEVERYTPKRISSEQVRTVTVEVPIREPGAWTAAAHKAMVNMLRLLGNAEWTFNFANRKVGTTLDTLGNGVRVNDRLETVSLFSGGLDSTCGLGWLKENGIDAVLASFYGSKAKQDAIAKALGFERLVQVGCTWDNGRRRFGGQFQYRSFLFLALGAVVARSFGAKELMQFENGPLSIAVPPSPTYRMTRHAHPKLHREAEILFAELFGSELVVRNPFLDRTKKEMADGLRKLLRKPKFDIVVKNTETCWNLTSRRVLGDIEKKPGVPCGLCVPCIVRRTALGASDVMHTVDLTDRTDSNFGNATARVHVDAYLEWARELTDKGYDEARFSFEAPQVVREAISNSGGVLSMDAAYHLCRRFSAELIETFPS